MKELEELLGPSYPLKFCEMHGPMFLGGTNLGVKMDPTRKDGLELTLFPVTKWLKVTYKGDSSFNPAEAGFNYQPGLPKKLSAAKAPATGQPIVAQVSTPTSHVFAEMKGKTKA